MIAYIISLQAPDAAHNQCNERLLRAAGFEVVFVSGVPGAAIAARDYYRQVLPYHAATGWMLSPGELGCTLAHREACLRIVERGDNHGLVLEEDALLDETACRELRQIAEQGLAAVSFLLMSTTPEAFGAFRGVRGRLVNQALRIFKVDDADLDRFAGACVYMVSRDAAMKMLAVHERGAYLADDYVYLRWQAGIPGFHYAPVVVASGYEASAIQDERLLQRRYFAQQNHKRSLRLLGQALMTELSSRFRIRWLVLRARLFGSRDTLR